MVYQRFCKNGKTSIWNDEERYEVKFGRKAAESVWEVEEEVYNEASLGNIRLGQGNESRDRCIRFYNR